MTTAPALKEGQTEPHTRAELEAALSDLLARIQTSEAELSDRDLRGPDGRRLDGHAYYRWRIGAVHARVTLTHEYRGLKARLRALGPAPKPAPPPPAPDPEGDLGALLALHRFTRGLA